MYRTFATNAVTENLLNEVARSSLSEHSQFKGHVCAARNST